jgi:hypothetical protein
MFTTTASINAVSVISTLIEHKDTYHNVDVSATAGVESALSSKFATVSTSISVVMGLPWQYTHGVGSGYKKS